MNRYSKPLHRTQLRKPSFWRAVLSILDHSLDALLSGRSPLARRPRLRVFASSREVLLLLLCTATAAQARIGETPAQLEVRYGTAIKTNGAWRMYEKDGYRIAVDFFNGKSAREIVFATTADKLTRETALKLGTQIANDAAWTAPQQSGLKTVWTSKDKTLGCCWMPMENAVGVMTSEFLRAEEVRKRKPLPGF